jgi:hypothetical protein
LSKLSGFKWKPNKKNKKRATTLDPKGEGDVILPKRRYLSKLHGMSVLLSHTRENLTSNREVDLQVNTEKSK